MERSTDSFIPTEHIECLGEEYLDTYKLLAKDSNVPADYIHLSQDITLNYFQDISPTTLALYLLKQEFDSTDEAWIAMRYAEAISAIKASDQFEIWPSVEHLVGMLVLLEQGKGDEVEDVKQRVENFFKDPLSVFHIIQLEEVIYNGEPNA